MTEFNELGLHPSLLQALNEAGYTIPTPIQAQAIPLAMAGRDVLGIAQTGTGKTAGFTLPMIDILSQGRARARMLRSLILEPTRELAAQVAASFETYGKYHKLNMALLIGGVSFDDQERKLDRGVDVLIATPGRLLDHFGRGKLMMNGVDILVIDEADRMLDMGFIPDIERIFKLTPPRRQTLFFSATMPPEITRLTTQFLKDPTRLEASRPAMTAETITQYLVRIPSSDPKTKRAALRALIGRADVKNGIVFCNRKTEVDVVAKSLKQHGFDAAPIHGDLDQSLRTKTLAAFRSGELKLLVASDVAARGLDIPDVSHVFNYDVSHHADDYVHRIGRTGRAGKTGQTFMIVTPADDRSLDKVLKLIKMDPEELVLDSADLGDSREPARREAGRPERPARGRARSAPPAPAADAESGVEATEVDAQAFAEPGVAEAAPSGTPAPAAMDESARPRRSRSRRSSRPAADATVEIGTSAPAAPPLPAPAAPTQSRPMQETHLRQSDRRGDRPEPETQRANGRPFGESEIPAFLRRTASLKG